MVAVGGGETKSWRCTACGAVRAFHRAQACTDKHSWSRPANSRVKLTPLGYCDRCPGPASRAVRCAYGRWHIQCGACSDHTASEQP